MQSSCALLGIPDESGYFVSLVPLGDRGATSDEAHPGNDHPNASPARERYLFMQEEFREQCEDDVSDRGGRKDKRKIGPRKGSEIAAEEDDEADNAAGDPGIEDGGDGVRPVGEMHFADVPHAARKQRVASTAEADDGEQDEILFEGHRKRITKGKGQRAKGKTEPRRTRRALRWVRGQREESNGRTKSKSEVMQFSSAF